MHYVHKSFVSEFIKLVLSDNVRMVKDFTNMSNKIQYNNGYTLYIFIQQGIIHSSLTVLSDLNFDFYKHCN